MQQKQCFERNFQHQMHILEEKSKTNHLPLAGMAQWVEHQPANQKVTSLILGQGSCLGCRPGPSWGHVRGSQSMFLSHTSMFLSLSFSLPSPLSKKKIKSF